MSQQTPTAHNSASQGEIARITLMPGDPLRAQFIAETYLDAPKQFNAVRNMYGYTGTYKGMRSITTTGWRRSSGSGRRALWTRAWS